MRPSSPYRTMPAGANRGAGRSTAGPGQVPATLPGSAPRNRSVLDSALVRVLVVEDDFELGRAVAAGLRSAGFATDLVGGVADADLRLSVNTYDCLVVDRGLPDGDGLALLRERREAGAAVPVLLLTAMDGIADRLAGFEEGADDYVVKPFALPELTARVRALCRRGAPSRVTVLRAGTLEMNRPRHRVRRDGVLLTLTAKEFAVLEVLLVRAGEVVTRSELIESCWDERAEPMSNVVDVVVGQLRRKLGPPDPLRTVRGVGYCLAPE